MKKLEKFKLSEVEVLESADLINASAGAVQFCSFAKDTDMGHKFSSFFTDTDTKSVASADSYTAIY